MRFYRADVIAPVRGGPCPKDLLRKSACLRGPAAAELAASPLRQSSLPQAHADTPLRNDPWGADRPALPRSHLLQMDAACIVALFVLMLCAKYVGFVCE